MRVGTGDQHGDEDQDEETLTTREIVRMIEDGKSDSEILARLDQEFPPGTFKTTNKAALRGTKRDLGR